ncbi:MULTISPECIES: hypothetical protein [unclassified Chelatococcus]|nr:MULTISPECIES: hypothetical protein [unclassified Chelatococcus]MBS7741385.1 hypothetical protein [Chelatococcus sp. HY11]MBX3546133.1 hypothetical protein [Chelatococcus sp.]MCO5077218.1 hypothetical protein [Chelatococcus sp.]
MPLRTEIGNGGAVTADPCLSGTDSLRVGLYLDEVTIGNHTRLPLNYA